MLVIFMDISSAINSPRTVWLRMRAVAICLGLRTLPVSRSFFLPLNKLVYTFKKKRKKERKKEKNVSSKTR
jgi:hypothetical protein